MKASKIKGMRETLLDIIPLFDKKSQYFIKNLRKNCNLCKADALLYQSPVKNILLTRLCRQISQKEKARSVERAIGFNSWGW